MEVLLVRAAVPFPCHRRSQKSAEASEPQKARAQKLLTSDRSAENSTKSSTVASASNRSADPQTSPFGTLVPLSAFPLKFPWFKAGKKDVGGVSTTMDVAAATACGDVASLALSSAHDDVTTLALSDEEKRTVHEVLSTLQSSPTELSALEVASIQPLASDDTVAEVTPGAMAPDDLAKAEAEIAKSWLHNFMKIRSLWNIRQFNTNTKVPRKQSLNSVKQPGAAVLEAEGTEKTQEDSAALGSIGGEDVSDSMSCVCEGCSVDTEDEKTAPGEEEAKEIAHVKIVHDRESFSKFLQSVPVAELKTVSHLSFLSNLAYAIPSIKVSELCFLDFSS